MRRLSGPTVLAALMLTALLVSGCTGSETIYRSERELGGAESVFARISAGSADVSLAGNAAVVEADFTFPSAWPEPEIEYEVSGTEGVLEIWQPDIGSSIFSGGRNKWDIWLIDDVPLELDLSTGSGTLDFDAEGMTFRFKHFDHKLGANTKCKLTNGVKVHHIKPDLFDLLDILELNIVLKQRREFTRNR